MFRSKLGLSFSLLIIIPSLTTVESKCSKGCDLALGSYYVWPGANLGLITQVSTNSIHDIFSYNTNITNNNYEVTAGTRINISFTCGCIDGESLGHVFPYQVNSGDTYHQIAQTYYANLTTVAMLEQFNGAVLPDMILKYEVLKVPVNCSCGDASVSEAYGLFITYPLRIEDSLESIAAAANLSKDLLQRYNPGANFSAGSGLVYIPGRGKKI